MCGSGGGHFHPGRFLVSPTEMDACCSPNVQQTAFPHLLLWLTHRTGLIPFVLQGTLSNPIQLNIENKGSISGTDLIQEQEQSDPTGSGHLRNSLGLLTDHGGDQAKCHGHQ